MRDEVTRAESTTPAHQAMALDILQHVLANADDPRKMGDYLAQHLRELTGARTAILVQSLHSIGQPGHRVLAVSPERRTDLAESPTLQTMYDAIHSSQTIAIWEPSGPSAQAAALREAGCGISVTVPLNIGPQRVGGITLLDVPDPHRIDTAIDILSTLSTAAALIFRNALLFEQQEQIVQQRTQALSQSEERMRHALEVAESANRAKDQFLAAASHELRTPLTPALLLISSHESDPDLPEEVRQDLKTAREHVEMEKRLIGDLLDFAAMRSGKLTMRTAHADLHQIVHDALRVSGGEIARKGLRVDLSLDAAYPGVTGDPERLLQVCWNLLQNAVKFTPPAGRIAIHTRNNETGIVLEVSDTGIGMDSQTLAKLFMPFEQGSNRGGRHFGGLGLGLAISKAIVEAHGGSISASSSGENQGSTFQVLLPAPRQKSEVTASAEPVEEELKPGQKMRLLLVEDHVPTLRVMARLLMNDGHEVMAATSVAEATTTAQTHSFDLVICDIGLPDGSGLDLMPVLREAHGLRGIALSGFGADTDREAAQAAGFADHITKPVRLEELRRALVRAGAGQGRGK